MLDFVKAQKDALQTISKELDEEAITQFVREKLVELHESMEYDLFASEERSKALVTVIEMYSTEAQKVEFRSKLEGTEDDS